MNETCNQEPIYVKDHVKDLREHIKKEPYLRDKRELRYSLEENDAFTLHILVKAGKLANELNRARKQVSWGESQMKLYREALATIKDILETEDRYVNAKKKILDVIALF